MKNYSFNQKAQSILTFKKWGRKNYSLFLMVKQAVKISVLAVAYFISAPAISVATEQDTTEVKMQYDLDEIEVSAQRSPALYSQVARIISVIESKEIEASPAQSVQELLEYVAGVDVRQRGAEGVQADVSIRGGTFDQTLILLNGINITDPQTGHHNFNLPISLSQVERIEVLEGPAARIYGPNAFSGAINIVTKQTHENLIDFYVSAGSYGFFNSNLSGSFKTGKVNHLIALNRKSSNGYIDNTDFGISNLFYSNQLNSTKGKLSFQVGASEKGFGANSFYTPKYPNQYEETKTLLTSVKWESNSKLHLSPVVYWRRHQDRFELFRDNPASWYKNHNYHLTNVYGGNLNSWIQWELGKTAFGVEFRSENILSNVLGEEMNSPQKVPGESAEFTKSASRNTTSFFLEHAVYLNNWSLTAGLMSNFISGSDLGINIFPGIDVSYNITSEIKVFSTFNTSLRMPTFTDLYYSGPTNIGNPNLKPEKSATVEGGLKVNHGFLQGHAIVFYREGKDIIDWVKMESDEVWQPQNLTQLNSLGTEMQVGFNLREQFGKHFPNKLNFTYFNNNLQKESQDIISNYVLDNLKHKFVGSINQSITKNIAIDLKASFQDREGAYTEFVENNYGSEVDYKPFWLFDAKVNYGLTRLNLFVSVNNIFDLSYNDIGNVVQPGRWIKAGISYQFKLD
ncbi:MAG: TonB-dependent receptor [Bacteroidetes bacterium]|nr:TonB-dependent receptor [Bacteroidota bacterium]